MKPLVIIPARGGSKGVPRKNIKILGEKPLIQYTIEAAREVFSDNVICVSTDDTEIKNCVEKIGLQVPFLRPAELATDIAGTNEVLLHAINYYEALGYFPDTIVLLQATSPFRRGAHILEALKLYSSRVDMIVSVKETKANPYFLLFEEDKEGYLVKSKNGDFVRRQDCPKVWEYNGAIYIIKIGSLKTQSMSKFQKVIKYEMDELCSHDIDTINDFQLAEIIFSNMQKKGIYKI